MCVLRRKVNSLASLSKYFNNIPEAWDAIFYSATSFVFLPQLSTYSEWQYILISRLPNKTQVNDDNYSYMVYADNVCKDIHSSKTKQDKTKPKNQSNLRLLQGIFMPIVLSVEVNNAVILGSSFFLRSEHFAYLKIMSVVKSSEWMLHQELFRICLRESLQACKHEHHK